MVTDDMFVIEHMTISGFNGLSGSMIGHFSDDDPSKPGVIGICKPLPYSLHRFFAVVLRTLVIGQSETYPLNRFMRFKEHGFAWIRETVMKDRASSTTLQ